MFYQNYRSDKGGYIEYCIKCGVKLENRVNKLGQKENRQCPYCGYHVSEPKSDHSNHLINNLNRSTITSSIFKFLNTYFSELRSFRWDDTFLKANFVLIVVLLGMMAIYLVS